ncbi:MAG: phosphoenolpyruvate synthase [Geminicoccaceae bacterium]|nr:phosphoenolpyruvate synthase [Geminicoccaceae bacterium]
MTHATIPAPYNPAAPAAQDSPRYVVPLDQVNLDDLPRVGGKNASLGEMLQALRSKGISVPLGFAVTADAFRLHLREAGLEGLIYRELDCIEIEDVSALASCASAIRARISRAPLPRAVAAQLRTAYEQLSDHAEQNEASVAVRSSATAEDLPTASFAGQQETYLNVRGFEALDRAVRACMASLFTDRAIVYRAERGIPHRDVALSVGVQQMVRSDLGSAGVIFTLDTESGFRDVVLITGAWGLGETVVQGRVRPDEFWVHKPTLRQGYHSIIRREISDKALKLVYAEETAKSVREVRVARRDRFRPVLSDEDVLTLARWALVIEDHYSQRAGHPTPMDIEWARDGHTGELFILQARPETVHAQATRPTLTFFRRRGEGEVLVTGQAVGSGVARGVVRVIRSAESLSSFRPGEVLVAPMTDPDWEPVLKRAAAVVTDEGGRTCHAAIVARELDIPCVVGTANATHVLTDGQEVTISCAEGDDGKVYAGTVPFDREEIDPSKLPQPAVPLMLNLANPERAFYLAQLPSDGVGLVRIEFVISNWIGIHPMALLHPERITDGSLPQIRARVGEVAPASEFFVSRLAMGIAQIGAAFYPRPVIVRFSDFKSNEYAGLLGGKDFEPLEANPMIGFRGASRYYDERYRAAFALECAAIWRVREEMGLSNVKVMIPFCRTLEEGKRVIRELAQNGLIRGQHGLEVYVMCEIPNNVILAEEFSDLFDGFSIGSNDLTQLALGVDRDSELLADLFDERDPGVKRLIQMVIAAAHKKGRRVGICGQAPSDYPEFAEYLVRTGIDSMSLNPDSLARVAMRLAAGPEEC